MKMIRVLMLIAATGLSFAQQPNIQNAKLETRSAGGGLQAQVDTIARSGVASWIAWSVPSVKGENNMCCMTSYNDGNYSTCGCALESGGVANISESSKGLNP